MDDKKTGVIQEQGFVAGEGLGFTEATEEEKDKLKEKSKD